MRFRLIGLALFIVLLPALSHAATSNAALKSQIEDIRKEREALVAEQERLQAELDKVTQEGKNLGTAVKSLDASKKKLAADIKVTQSKISATDLNIRVLENNVTTAERQINLHEAAISETIRSLFESDSRPIALSILAAENFTDLWRDRAALQTLGETLDDEVASLRSTKNALTLEKAAKEKSREQIATLQKDLTSQKAVVEENQKAKEKLLAETKNKEAAYQALLAENLARQKQFEEDLFRLESALNLNIDESLVAAPRHGVLSWPLSSIFVTNNFGKVSGVNTRIYASGSHNGTDFRASQGTAVKSMGNGVVAGLDNTDAQAGCGSYGRWLVISYDNGLSSVYGHLSGISVQKGQKVTAGQVVAYSGGTPGVYGSGYSTGPHLHVGLFATQGMEIRKFVESRGCKQVTVPIVDVKAYLDPLAYLPAL